MIASHPLRARALALTLILAIVIRKNVATAKSVSVVSSSVCFSHLECPDKKYCKTENRDDDLDRSGVCTPRGAPGATCQPVDAFSCRYGSFCQFREYPKKPTCVRLPGAGMKCDPMIATTCAPGLRCTKDGKCRASKTTGGIGTLCRSDFNCAIEKGLACDLFIGKCARRKKFGEPCSTMLTSSSRTFKRIRSQDCVGYCREGAPDAILGTCAPRRVMGQSCDSTLQCWSAKQIPRYREDPPRCNHGKCVLESKVLKRLGEPCEPSSDRCDARRKMRCLWSAVKKRAVCQQRGPFDSVCTPDSPFSRCIGLGADGRPLECREYRGLRAYVDEWRTSRFFRCLQRSRPEVLGGPCPYGVEKCPAGSACRRVPYYVYSNREFIRGVRHTACMRLLPAGADCTKNRLKSMCGDGLKCSDRGKCVKGTLGIDRKYIRAGLYSSCVDSVPSDKQKPSENINELPCAPGLVCLGPRDYSFCQLPTEPVGLGEICGGRIRKKCKEGLICSYKSVYRCIKKQKGTFF